MSAKYIPEKYVKGFVRHVTFQYVNYVYPLLNIESTQKNDILFFFQNKRKMMKKDLKDFKKSIYSKYQDAASNIPVQRADVKKYYQKLKTNLTKQVKSLPVQTDVNNIFHEMQAKIDEMDAQHLAAIDKQEDAIKHSATEIEHIMLNLNSLIDNSDGCLFFKYKSRNEEFMRLPDQFQATMPVFIPQKMNNKKQINQSIGSLSELAITYPLLDEPRLLIDIRIHRKEQYGEFSGVSCLSNSELWTCRNDNTMRLYNLQGELLKKVKTKSGNVPFGISVTKNRDLLYTDPDDRSLNLVRNTRIKTLLKRQGWKPFGVCSTSSGDILVIMESSNDDLLRRGKNDNCFECDVMGNIGIHYGYKRYRPYSDSKEKQSIQG